MLSFSQLKPFQIISVGSHKFSTDERYSVVFDHINRDKKLSQNYQKGSFFVTLREWKKVMMYFRYRQSERLFAFSYINIVGNSANELIWWRFCRSFRISNHRCSIMHWLFHVRQPSWSGLPKYKFKIKVYNFYWSYT